MIGGRLFFAGVGFLFTKTTLFVFWIIFLYISFDWISLSFALLLKRIGVLNGDAESFVFEIL